MANALNKPHFQDAEKAREYLEARIWPHGPVCPHCGSAEKHYALSGSSTRPGVYKCSDCREQFTVTVGTVFERSKIALNVWLQAVYLLCSSKKGMSSHQLHRTIGVTYKTAWFMSHRIRLAMDSADGFLFGQGGGSVEVDETFLGTDATKAKPKNGPAQKRKVLSLIDRNSGRARSLVVDNLKSKTLIPILRKNIDKGARVLTDDASYYSPLSLSFAQHDSVNHSKLEYVRMSDRRIHTNTVEGFFSIFKRGMKGVYQHCAHHHLDRYVTEFDFRYSNRARLGVDDAQRADKALKGISGKRLTYR
jgi:transposase-like protein